MILHPECDVKAPGPTSTPRSPLGLLTHRWSCPTRLPRHSLPPKIWPKIRLRPSHLRLISPRRKCRSSPARRKQSPGISHCSLRSPSLFRLLIICSISCCKGFYSALFCFYRAFPVGGFPWDSRRDDPFSAF